MSAKVMTAVELARELRLVRRNRPSNHGRWIEWRAEPGKDEAFHIAADKAIALIESRDAALHAELVARCERLEELALMSEPLAKMLELKGYRGDTDSFYAMDRAAAGFLLAVSALRAKGEG